MWFHGVELVVRPWGCRRGFALHCRCKGMLAVAVMSSEVQDVAVGGLLSAAAAGCC